MNILILVHPDCLIEQYSLTPDQAEQYLEKLEQHLPKFDYKIIMRMARVDQEMIKSSSEETQRYSERLIPLLEQHADLLVIDNDLGKTAINNEIGTFLLEHPNTTIYLSGGYQDNCLREVASNLVEEFGDFLEELEIEVKVYTPLVYYYRRGWGINELKDPLPWWDADWVEQFKKDRQLPKEKRRFKEWGGEFPTHEETERGQWWKGPSDKLALLSRRLRIIANRLQKYNKQKHMEPIKRLDREIFGEALPDSELFICDGLFVGNEQECLGYILWDTISQEVPHIRSFAVSPKNRGAGLGKQLMLQAIEILGDEITLTLDNENKEFLENFYTKLGFKPTNETNPQGNRIWKYTSNHTESCLLKRLRITIGRLAKKANKEYFNEEEILEILSHDIPDLKIEKMPGDKRDFAGTEEQEIPFAYGEIPNYINPADDMGWDVIIVPSAVGLPKEKLAPIGLLRYRTDVDFWDTLPGDDPIGNDKILLGERDDQKQSVFNGTYQKSDLDVLSDFIQENPVFEKLGLLQDYEEEIVE